MLFGVVCMLVFVWLCVCLFVCLRVCLCVCWLVCLFGGCWWCVVVVVVVVVVVLLILLLGRPSANDHQDGSAFCKSSSGWVGILQMIIQISSFQPYSSPFFFLFSANFLFSSNKHHLLLQNISSSSSNLSMKVQSPDFSRTICSCLT